MYLVSPISPKYSSRKGLGLEREYKMVNKYQITEVVSVGPRRATHYDSLVGSDDLGHKNRYFPSPTPFPVHAPELRRPWRPYWRVTERHLTRGWWTELIWDRKTPVKKVLGISGRDERKDVPTEWTTTGHELKSEPLPLPHYLLFSAKSGST